MPSIYSGQDKAWPNLNDRLFHIMGSSLNRQPLVLIAAGLNNVKGAVHGMTAPVSQDNFKNLINTAITTGTGEDALFESLHQVIMYPQTSMFRG